MIESKGPTNTRVYTVAVYFKGDRLAKADGPSIQTAEMNAAKLALETCGHLFPHLDYQKKIVERSLKKNKDHIKQTWAEEVRKKRKLIGLDEINEECSKRNDERLKNFQKAKKLANQSKEPEPAPARAPVSAPVSAPAPTIRPESAPAPEQGEPKQPVKRKVVSDEPKEEGECSDDSDD